MSATRIRLEQWKETFRAIGLDDGQMLRWHREFEQRHPALHQEFLEWLGLPQDRIAEVRRQAGTGRRC